ncbi:MAG: 3'-5' exonuclease domain-containing protein 2 [Candidatus Electrothrix sp. AR4]|nr:3'-5' exonuclease domain-containing protein 2 [Candidatus Electrothrix sp. AR4]
MDYLKNIQQQNKPGFDRHMTKQEINSCPVRKWEGTTHVIRTNEEMMHAVDKLSSEDVLGFDTETRPAFRKGQKYSPTLLQLAGAGEVFLFQLKMLGLRQPLLSLLTDPGIIKVGVAIKFDLQELNKLTRFTPAGFVELGTLSKKKGIKNNGLRGLAAVVLGLRITKSAQTSNWARDELTQSQISYAATDAWVGREIFLRLSA